MKRAMAFLITMILGMTLISAIACPKGEHPYGGTGSHHKGGHCA